MAFQSNNKAFNANSAFASEMEAQHFLNEQLRTQPGLKNALHIIPDYELQSL